MERFEVVFDLAVDEINDCESLFVDQIGEASELTLDLVIVEAKAQATITELKENDPLSNILLGARPIETDATCRRFHLRVERRNMVFYSVLDECYGIYPERPEEFTGRLFRTFSKSNLLEFTRRTTNASDEWPGKLHHYQVACLNHVIDIIATASPTIAVELPDGSPIKGLRLLGGSDPGAQYIPRRRSALPE